QTLTGREGNLAVEFGRLAAEWRSDTEFHSSITRIAMHPAYQRIIGMGRPALPLILHDLKATSAPWFWALRAISGVDVVPASDRGYVDRMVWAWLRWGRSENLI